MRGTRRLIILGGLGLGLCGTAEAKRQKRNKRNKKRKQDRRPRGPVDHDTILAGLVTLLRFGLADDKLSLRALEQKIARGAVVECQCTRQSQLAARAINRAGGRARVVGAFMYPFNTGPNTGHVMMEVRDGDHWVCYDVMGKVQAVDANGVGCSLAEWCTSSEHLWRRIGDDGGFYPREQDLAAIYARLLHTPWVGINESPFKAVFYDADVADAALIAKTYPWLRQVPETDWQRAST
jgi:hypothetical protein